MVHIHPWQVLSYFSLTFQMPFEARSSAANILYQSKRHKIENATKRQRQLERKIKNNLDNQIAIKFQIDRQTE